MGLHQSESVVGIGYSATLSKFKFWCGYVRKERTECSKSPRQYSQTVSFHRINQTNAKRIGF
jgi:hypothetical protein